MKKTKGMAETSVDNIFLEVTATVGKVLGGHSEALERVKKKFRSEIALHGGTIVCLDDFLEKPDQTE